MCANLTVQSHNFKGPIIIKLQCVIITHYNLIHRNIYSSALRLLKLCCENIKLMYTFLPQYVLGNLSIVFF